MPGIRIPRSTAAIIASLAVALLALAFAPAEAAPPQQPSRSSAPPASLPLDTLLAKAAEYCRRLESSAFDLVCREEIRETIDPKLDTSQKAVRPVPGSANDFGPGAPSYLGPTLVISTVRKVKHSFVYDYQCVRAGRTIREARTQLEENGKRKIVPDAALRTSMAAFGAAFLGPVGLFGEHVQPGYDFAIAGRDRIGDIPVVIIDVKPRPGAPDTRNLYGQAWVDPATGEILKTEWSESRVGRSDVFEKRGELFKRTPRLVNLSEFSAEKNGIRFPSRLYFEEAYLRESGQAFIRSKTEVVYKDFRFFKVEFEVRD